MSHQSELRHSFQDQGLEAWLHAGFKLTESLRKVE